MDYVIKNHKNVYIRLNKHGTAVTCAEQDKTLFEKSKAENILECLPKTLKRLKFKVEAIPDIGTNKHSEQEKVKPEVIQKENYILSKNITRWIDKFGICDDILTEAKHRKEELIAELSNVDREFSNLIHRIELEGRIDLYGGWIERNKIKSNREKRREIKDELIIISNVLRMDFKCLSSESVKKAVEGLANRKFTLRLIEEEDENAV